MVRAFRRSYERDEKTGDIIDWYLEDRREYTFSSMREFKNTVTGFARNTHLVIQCTHATHPGPYIIRMTGSRTGDYDAANAVARLASTPGGYTWHHHESIKKVGSAYECQMYLIETPYHSKVRHNGGVYYYERQTGRGYR